MLAHSSVPAPNGNARAASDSAHPLPRPPRAAAEARLARALSPAALPRAHCVRLSVFCAQTSTSDASID